MPHTLYIVGTPLGNAADWSLRAQQVLAATPVIAAEDTRVTARLLAHGPSAIHRWRFVNVRRAAGLEVESLDSTTADVGTADAGRHR